MTAPHGYTILKVEPLFSKANGDDARGYFPDLHGAELYRAQEPAVRFAAVGEPVCWKGSRSLRL